MKLNARHLRYGFFILCGAALAFGCASASQTGSASAVLATGHMEFTTSQIVDSIVKNPLTAADIHLSGQRTFNELYESLLAPSVSFDSVTIGSETFTNLHAMTIAMHPQFTAWAAKYPNVQALWTAKNIVPQPFVSTAAEAMASVSSLVSNLRAASSDSMGLLEREGANDDGTEDLTGEQKQKISQCTLERSRNPYGQGLDLLQIFSNCKYVIQQGGSY